MRPTGIKLKQVELDLVCQVAIGKSVCVCYHRTPSVPTFLISTFTLVNRFELASLFSRGADSEKDIFRCVQLA